MEPRRLPYLAQPGEALLLVNDVPEHAARFSQLLTDTALDDRSVLSTSLVSVPLPIKRRSAGPRGWPETMNVTALWHPLYWLPERIAYRWRAEDGTIESDDEWATRVALEATIASLYDPVTGTWLDCLSLVGLDVDDEATQKRLRDWLAGAADPTLDSIDLSGQTELADDLHWAVRETAELLPTLKPASWSLAATDLLGLLAAPGLTTAEHIATAANLSLGVLRDVPGASDAEPGAAVQFERALIGIDQGVSPEAVAEHLIGVLRSIQADYLPFVELLQQEMGADEL